ncbi:MAG: serine/threonine-protein kinase, partial [Planctomycetota bacterium]
MACSPLPSEYGGRGCVVLVDDRHVVELVPGEEQTCNGFGFRITRDAKPADFSLQRLQSDSVIDVVVIGNSLSGPEAGIADKGPENPQQGRLFVDSIPAAGDASVAPGDSMLEGAAAEVTSEVQFAGHSETGPSVLIEVYPKLPGYRLLESLGRGGMGRVWRAHQRSTNRDVAIKTILPKMLSRPKAKLRFRREVELAASLRHTGLATVFDSGEVFGHHYYSMELIHGMTWDRYVREARPSRRTILSQLLEVIQAIAHAHEKEVIHRDLKPSNVMIDSEGRPVVVDFGLAKQRCPEAESGAPAGDLVGTLAFMAPEQASGEGVGADTRSDIFSLGAVMLHFLRFQLTGQWAPGVVTRPTGDTAKPEVEPTVSGPPSSPFADQGPTLECSRSSLDTVTQVASFVGDDPELIGILSKALAVDPDERYQTAKEFGEDLRRYLSTTNPDRAAADGTETGRFSIAAKAGMVAIVSATLVFGIAAFMLSMKPQTTYELMSREQRIAEKFEGMFAADFQTDGSDVPSLDLTRAVGGKYLPDYTIVHPEGWPLVGFRFCTFEHRGDLIIKVLQPVFR